MEKTLQQQYNLIKEGRGNKDDFLKSARRVFPEFISPLTNYTDAVTILKGKSILSEAVGGIVTQNPNKPDWFKIFDTNLKEAVGVKDKKEYGDQNAFEKIDKEVAKALESNFNNKDDKNIDNLYGQSFLMGYYTEMKDPKNAGKTVDELKAIVAKNMAKDITYYNTETSFGVKGIGYKKDVVGGGEPKEPKGKHKSSGYGDIPKVVKESQLRSLINSIIKEELNYINPSDLKKGIDLLGNIYYYKKSKKDGYIDVAERDKLGRIVGWNTVKFGTGIFKEELNEAHPYYSPAIGSNAYNRMKAIEQAKTTSKEEGVVQHVNYLSNGSYEVSDFYDKDTTVASFENGRKL